LFISRNYPPQVGGLEAYSYHLIQTFEKHLSTRKIILSRPRKHLFWFIPYALCKALGMQIQYPRLPIHLCDALLSPVGLLLKKLTGTRVTATIHGLDITFGNPVYQKIVPRCAAKLDRVICVSRATLEECLNRGFQKKKCTVIPNGIDPDSIYRPGETQLCREALSKKIGKDLQGKKILLTVGRLVARKGVTWFTEMVLPRLSSSHIYLVAGEGPEEGAIQAIIERLGLAEKAFLLGRVSKQYRNLLFNAADLFIMPNIRVKNDIEGFGIVAIEAGSCGVPVVASNLQGIRDAVIHGETGYLVEERDSEGFRKAIESKDLQRDKVRSVVTANFSWDNIFRRYRRLLLPDRLLEED
jgi:glycosyltransferase involved in cell wall biosynthesis